MKVVDVKNYASFIKFCRSVSLFLCPFQEFQPTDQQLLTDSAGQQAQYRPTVPSFCVSALNKSTSCCTSVAQVTALLLSVPYLHLLCSSRTKRQTQKQLCHKQLLASIVSEQVTQDTLHSVCHNLQLLRRTTLLKSYKTNTTLKHEIAQTKDNSEKHYG